MLSPSRTIAMRKPKAPEANRARILAAADYYMTVNHAMVAQVPISGSRTIYSRIGDLLAWLCLLGLFVSIGMAVVAPVRPR